eukprot:CAMPEP_0180568778 /NCGR_PEP_ID=MMETSP1037_2-20121125/7336_1 /TAXON_ID=632150 /ORGANISM="Azadinium spinosum, Strain 3D9" /LENGTH=160 /DNA_ID=CAMNT_0022585989 /DNA_START=341 /DNA_END=823 /DNA_ORIENTATION=+
MNSHGASLRISTEKYSFGIAKLLDFSPHDAGDAFNLCAPLLQIDLIVVGLHVGCIILREVLVPEVIPVLIYRAVREDVLDSSHPAQASPFRLLCYESIQPSKFIRIVVSSVQQDDRVGVLLCWLDDCILFKGCPMMLSFLPGSTHLDHALPSEGATCLRQ